MANNSNKGDGVDDDNDDDSDNSNNEDSGASRPLAFAEDVAIHCQCRGRVKHLWRRVRTAAWIFCRLQLQSCCYLLLFLPMSLEMLTRSAAQPSCGRRRCRHVDVRIELCNLACLGASEPPS